VCPSKNVCYAVKSLCQTGWIPPPFWGKTPSPSGGGAGPTRFSIRGGPPQEGGSLRFRHPCPRFGAPCFLAVVLNVGPEKGSRQLGKKGERKGASRPGKASANVVLKPRWSVPEGPPNVVKVGFFTQPASNCPLCKTWGICPCRKRAKRAKVKGGPNLLGTLVSKGSTSGRNPAVWNPQFRPVTANLKGGPTQFLLGPTFGLSCLKGPRLSRNLQGLTSCATLVSGLMRRTAISEAKFPSFARLRTCPHSDH